MNNYEDVMERKREEIRVLSDYLQIYFEKKTLNSIRLIEKVNSTM